jgi:hypothetical protein
MIFLQRFVNLVALSMHIPYFKTKRILQVPQFDKKLEVLKLILFFGIFGATAFLVGLRIYIFQSYI